MKKLMIGLMFFSGSSFGAVNIYVNPPAPTTLQAELIASVTNQYLATVTKSAYLPNTFTLNVTGKNPNYIPPAPSSPVLTSTAFQECVSYGFGNGMESERKDDLSLIDGLKTDILITSTCGGIIGTTPAETSALLQGCDTAYNLSKNAISQRDGLEPQITFIKREIIP